MSSIRIFLINELPSTQTVYGFLGTPQSIGSAPIYYSSGVYATLPAAPSAQTNVWTFPMRHHLIALSGLRPVGPHFVPQSSAAQLVQPHQRWQASFFQARGQRRGPQLQLTHGTASGGLWVATNRYDKALEAPSRWYGGLGIALSSPMGAMRQLWSPGPLQRYAIALTPVFYVYNGGYVPQRYLAASAVPAQAQRVAAGDWDAQGRCTVIFHGDGTRSVHAGPPT